MAFMIPEYEKGRFYAIENRYQGVTFVPEDAFVASDVQEDEEVDVVSGWFARLSAPGYLDCTDWAGPFNTKKEAKAWIEKTYDVDPETGDDLP